MTIESQLGKVTVNGNGAATSFSFSPVIIFTEDDLLVTKNVGGVETVISQGNSASQYTLVVSSFPGTGSITYPSTGSANILETGETLTIKRVVPLLQQINLENQGGYFPEVQEEGFDRGVVIDIQQQEDIDRAIKFPVSYNGGVAPSLTSPTAGQYIRVNSAGDALEFASITYTEASSSDDNPEDISLTLPSPGLSENFSRGDHVHQLAIGDTLTETSDVLDVADEGITLAKMVSGTRGGIIIYSVDGAATELAPGTDGQVLTSSGASADPAWENVSSIPVGCLMDYAGTTAPSGWLLCYGQAINRTTYADLFTAISTTFGVGDGSTTFNLPDLRGRVSAGKDDMGGVSANRLTDQSGGLDGDTLGDTGGSETHTLTGAQSGIAAHAHNIQAYTDGSSGAAGAVFDTPADETEATDDVSAADAAESHNNVQPTIILNKIIKT